MCIRHTIPSMSWYYIYLQITSPKIIPKKIYRFDMFLTSNFCPKCTRKSLTLATSAHHTFTSLHVASKAGSNWTYPSWQPCKQTFVHNNFGGLSKKIFTKFPKKYFSSSSGKGFFLREPPPGLASSGEEWCWRGRWDTAAIASKELDLVIYTRVFPKIGGFPPKSSIKK